MSAATRSNIREMVSLLKHRGPDQQGVFESESISLGATRLKILDLKGGDQPIVSGDGNLAIAFNGEIYNHLDLRSELERRGYGFRSHSDTETVLAAFAEWGIEAFRRLRGMFAVALWSEAEKRLVLARDRMGIKPLYISRIGRNLIFGSEMKALFAHPETSRRLNLEGLDCYLSLNYVPCPLTLVEGIEKLQPGYWLEWANGSMRSEPYWQLPFKPVPNADDHSPERLEDLLQQSVSEHLLSDVPVGVWLSGGLDSSTILHYASRAASSPLKTFSITFNGRSFDESAYIKEVVSLYGTQHEQFDLNPDSGLSDAVEEFAYYSDDPNADAGALPVWFLSKLSRPKVTVALSGEGADELFGGYVTYRADKLAGYARRMPGLALKFLRRFAAMLPVSDEKIGFEYKLKRFFEGAERPPEHAHIFWNGTFSDAAKQEMIRSPLPNALALKLAQLRDRGNDLKAAMWFDQQYYLADDILAKSDRMSMAHSLEVRPPFLDHRIVEFSASLPSDLQVRGSKQKVILRDLMRKRLPPAVLNRPKAGFDIPAHDWLRGPLRPLITETLMSGIEEYGEVFERAAIEKYLNRHLQRIENLGYHLWGLMILFLWMKRWKIEAAPFLGVGRERSGALSTPIWQS